MRHMVGLRGFVSILYMHICTHAHTHMRAQAQLNGWSDGIVLFEIHYSVAIVVKKLTFDPCYAVCLCVNKTKSNIDQFCSTFRLNQ